MKIFLKKDMEQREVSAGNAWYVLTGFIPFIGGILLLVLLIVKKQFKGVFLNMLIISAIATTIYLFSSVIFFAISEFLGVLFLLLGIVAFFALAIYLYVLFVRKANRYALAQYLEDGYEIINMDQLDEEAKVWVEESKDIKREKFLLLKF